MDDVTGGNYHHILSVVCKGYLSFYNISFGAKQLNVSMLKQVRLSPPG